MSGEEEKVGEKEGKNLRGFLLSSQQGGITEMMEIVKEQDWEGEDQEFIQFGTD